MALNPVGSCINPASNDLWARPFELDGEFGPAPAVPASPVPLTPLGGSKLDARTAGANTTIAVVATDAVLNKAQAQRLAIMASDGMARAIRPIHTPYDGDTVFALATGKTALGDQPDEALSMLGSAAADCLSTGDRARHGQRTAPAWPRCLAVCVRLFANVSNPALAFTGTTG